MKIGRYNIEFYKDELENFQTDNDLDCLRGKSIKIGKYTIEFYNEHSNNLGWVYPLPFIAWRHKYRGFIEIELCWFMESRIKIRIIKELETLK